MLPAPEEWAVSSSRKATDYMRRLIFDGYLRGGERVPQDEVAAALGVSRVPIREALVALQREGWVTFEHHRGAFVVPMTAQSVQDHFELLGIAYGVAARRAVERGDDQLPQRLAEISTGFADLDDADRVSRAALDFHNALVDASGSVRIRSVLRSIRPFVPGNFYVQVPGAAAFEKRSTTVIRRAVERKDGAAAADAYMQMLRRFGEMVVEVLVERGVILDPR